MLFRTEWQQTNSTITTGPEFVIKQGVVTSESLAHERPKYNEFRSSSRTLYSPHFTLLSLSRAFKDSVRRRDLGDTIGRWRSTQFKWNG